MNKKTRLKELKEEAEKDVLSAVDKMPDEVLMSIGFGVLKVVTIAFAFGALVGYLVTK